MLLTILCCLAFLQDTTGSPDLQQVSSLVKSASPSQLPDLFSVLSERKNVSEKEVAMLIPFLSDTRSVLENVVIPDNTQVSLFASEALAEIGEVAIPKLLEFLKSSDDAETRVAVLKTFYKMAVPSNEVQQTMETLISQTNKDPSTQQYVIYALGASAEEIESAIKTLVAVPKDADYVIRLAVARTLGEIGKGSIQSTGKLLQLSKDEISQVRGAAISSLGMTASSHNSTVVARLKRISRHDQLDSLRAAAFKALGEIAKRRNETKGTPKLRGTSSKHEGKKGEKGLR